MIENSNIIIKMQTGPNQPGMHIARDMKPGVEWTTFWKSQKEIGSRNEEGITGYQEPGLSL